MRKEKYSMITVIGVWENTWYMQIKCEALKGNYRESSMYILLCIVQREYLTGKPLLFT